jgi:hypothetical protein
MIAKPVPGGGYCTPLDELLTRTELRDGVAATPAIVQPRLRGPDVRIYRIGNRTFGFRIDDAALDYRTSRDCRITPAERLPNSTVHQRSVVLSGGSNKMLKQPGRPVCARDGPSRRLMMIIGVLFILVALQAMWDAGFAQKGAADADWYPAGYGGATWTGEVTAIDNDKRTLTLTHGSKKNAETFVASIPDAPYQWRRDARNSRVLDFPYDMRLKVQTYVYVGPGLVANILPDGAPAKVHVPNPPAENVITDLSDFKGRRVVVYYTARDREDSGQKMNYNDVWRVRVISGKK